MDFTLTAYLSIIQAALDAGYKPMAVVDLFDNPTRDDLHLVLRHDVDRRPKNALVMAEAEAKHGVRSTYYFRIIKETLKPDLIREIAALGHEIGYHYEDFFTARYDDVLAYKLFTENLEKLRELAPIRTISMHGSPLAKFNNMKIWETQDYRSHGVEDCTLSFDWSNYVFFTDTGRSFGAGRTNLRDKIGSRSAPAVTTSKQLVAFLANKGENGVKISTHPERWNEGATYWARQFAVDGATNVLKVIISGLRPKNPA